MRTLSCIIVSFCLFITVSIASAQQNDDNKAIAAFENRVTLFVKFFAARPNSLVMESYDDSPTGYIYYWSRYDNCEVSYDIQKTTSVVSPYMGYITVKCNTTQTKKCGEIGPNLRFSSLEEARKNRDNDSCYVKSFNYGYKFIFALQKEQWIFKDVINTDNNETNKRLTNILGHSVDRKFVVEDNDFWQVLIQR